MPAPYRVFQPTTRILSTNSAPDLLHWVSDSLEAGVMCLLLDLREVMFMDSSGLGSLVIAHNRVHKAGGRLALCSLNGQARMIIEMADLGTMLDIYDHPQHFLSTFSSRDSAKLPEGDSPSPNGSSTAS